MNLTDLIFGTFALIVGLYTLYLRFTDGFQHSQKYHAMKSRFGEKTGTYIHIVAYTVMPLVIGVVMIYLSFKK